MYCHCPAQYKTCAPCRPYAFPQAAHSQKHPNHRTPWHPAAVQAFENEFENWRKDLAIEAEYQLTTEPLRIDILVVKKKRDVVIKKNIAQIFRQCNIIEFKSPDDSATVAAYNKTHAYARLYASLNNVEIGNLSVTVSATRHPRTLLAFLKKKFTVRQEQQGIYVVEGEVYPTQIIVGAELSEKDNFWLANLRKDLTAEQLAKAITMVGDRSDADAYIHASTNANAKTLEELYMKKKQGVIFTEKLDAYFKDKYGATFIAKGIAIGEAKEIEARRNAVITVLRTRFKRVPKEVEKSINQMIDSVALESWLVQAAACQSIDEFVQALK